MKKQKQIAVVVEGLSVYELNSYLSRGYTVATTCPMPSSLAGDSFSNYKPQCLVILAEPEKE